LCRQLTGAATEEDALFVEDGKALAALADVFDDVG
jgi:hypothetical protein